MTTKEPFTEADALRLLPEAERIEGTDVIVQAPDYGGHAFPAGLVRRDDGAMMQPNLRRN